MPEIHFRPYRLNPKMACEMCVFGQGSHLASCPVAAKAKATFAAMENCGFDPFQALKTESKTKMACERCCFGTGKHADFCLSPYRAPFAIFGMDVWIDPGMSRHEPAIMIYPKGMLRVGAHASTNKAELLPGYKPPPPEPGEPMLRVSKIDYETKTVTFDTSFGQIHGHEAEPGVTVFPVQAIRPATLRCSCVPGPNVHICCEVHGK